MGRALSIVHTSLHTTVTCSALHLSALSGRVIQLTETTGQPGIAPIRPGERAQPLAARGASSVILMHSRRKCRSQPARRQPLCATGWADQSDPGLSGGLRELENAPAERGQVSGRPCDRGVNSRVSKCERGVANISRSPSRQAGRPPQQTKLSFPNHYPYVLIDW